MPDKLQELCAKVAKETDPKKLCALIDELCTYLKEEQANLKTRLAEREKTVLGRAS